MYLKGRQRTFECLTFRGKLLLKFEEYLDLEASYGLSPTGFVCCLTSHIEKLFEYIEIGLSTPFSSENSDRNSYRTQLFFFKPACSLRWFRVEANGITNGVKQQETTRWYDEVVSSWLPLLRFTVRFRVHLIQFSIEVLTPNFLLGSSRNPDC